VTNEHLHHHVRVSLRSVRNMTVVIEREDGEVSVIPEAVAGIITQKATSCLFLIA
jgi:hypothetical protein